MMIPPSPVRRPVTRSDWSGLLLPVFEPARVPPPERPWTRSQWQRIAAGALPEATDGRWLAFVEHDRLYLHRAATGSGIYEVQFERRGLGRRIVEVLVSTSRFEYRRSSDECETLHVEAVIETFLLRRNVPDKWRMLTTLRSAESSAP